MKDLLSNLRGLWLTQRKVGNEKYNRTLPFADYIVDRWERAAELGFGEGSSVYDSCLVLGNVQIGKNVWIGPNTILDGSGGLEIGNGSCISAGVQIYSHDTISRTINGEKEPIAHAKTVIGANCYIGPGSIIAKGLSIGDRVVIGALSLVLDDIPSNVKAFGAPCKVQGSHNL